LDQVMIEGTGQDLRQDSPLHKIKINHGQARSVGHRTTRANGWGPAGIERRHGL